MKTKTRTVLAVATVVIVAGVVAGFTRILDPVVGIPGGKLSGTEQRNPTEWNATLDVGTVQLETRPDDPYSVNVWGVGIGQHFYVATHAQGTGWSRNIDANANVRLRVGETIYPLKAVNVGDDAERQRVLDAYVRKYAADPEDMAVNAALIYRLDAR